MVLVEYLPLPQPADLTTREKDDAMGAYLMMFAAWGVGLPLPLINVLAAVIYYFVNRDKGLFVKFHAHQSMMSQVAIGLINAGVIFWVIRCLVFENFTRAFGIYVIVAVVLNIIYFILSILGAVRARHGRFFYFPLFGKLAYHQTFHVSKNDSTRTYVNEPPA